MSSPVNLFRALTKHGRCALNEAGKLDGQESGLYGC